MRFVVVECERAWQWNGHARESESCCRVVDLPSGREWDGRAVVQQLLPNER
jgi:hypothetical protein